MYRKKWKTLAFMLMLIFTVVPPMLGCETEFRDVDSSHWAYQEINQLAEKGVITGYPDQTFKPGSTVTRAEFAKMMVLALNLPITKSGTSFSDISEEHWACSYIETAKYYLTGFRSATDEFFKPDSPAVREDLAVALVKALGLENQEVEYDLPFVDSDSISSNLRKYVAIAYRNNLMQGDQLGNQQTFRPQDALIRAEAAVLLAKISAGGLEKVTYDGKTTTPPQEKPVDYTAPQVEGEIDGDKILLRWPVINDRGFQGYKVVISKYNSRPRYPEDGYLYYITDKNRNYAVIDNAEPYKGGDFGGYLIPGEEYFFSITALYKDRKVPGSVISLTYPEG